jgi:FkbM family methyltransferase
MKFKSLVTLLPEGRRRALKKIYYRRQIKAGRFASAESEYGIIDDYVRAGDNVVDIGANVGHYTLKFSELVGPSGRVFAFEPIRATFSILCENVTLSRFPNITLINAAVSDAQRATAMIVPDDNYYMAHMADTGSEQVFCFTLECLFPDVTINFLKVDAEGQDLRILEAGTGLIKRCRPTIMAELSPEDVTGLAERFGYSIRRLESSHNVIMVPR